MMNNVLMNLKMWKYGNVEIIDQYSMINVQ
jgi:hypothetical protein